MFVFPSKLEQAMEEDFVTAKKLEDFLVVDSNAERLVEKMSKLYSEQVTTEGNFSPAEP